MHFGVPTQVFSENLMIIRSFFVNFYLYRKNGTTIGFDTGFTGFGSRRELDKAGIAPETVTDIFLTHSDSDHIGGLNKFSRAKTWISSLEKPLINGELKRFFFFNNPPPPATATFLDHHQTIWCNDIKIISLSTPGHTVGSMSYLVDDSVLIVGDTIELVNNRATTGASVFHTDVRQQQNSLRALALLRGIKTLCTGHSGISNDFHYAMAPWRTTHHPAHQNNP